MKSFLSRVVANILQESHIPERTIFILPSKRAVSFLKRIYAQQHSATGFAPQFYHIEHFIEQLSRLKQTHTTELLFVFYGVYKQVVPPQEIESFASFSKWAPRLLQDFNEIDRYLLDASQLFEYLKAIKDLNHWSSDTSSELVQNYLRFWSSLLPLYQQLRETLIQQGQGYQGMLYREAVDNLEYYTAQYEDHVHYFVGFNALNTAEETIVKTLLQSGNSNIYWDTDQSYIEDQTHDAGLFQRAFLSEWRHFQTEPMLWQEDYLHSPKEIEILGLPSDVAQVQQIAQLIEEFHDQDPTLQNTAVVLADEALLLPLLNALPKHIGAVNITMGFPVSYTPMTHFFERFLELYTTKGNFYHKKIQAFLSIPFFHLLFSPEETSAFVQHIQEHNISFINLSSIQEHFTSDFTNIIFRTNNYDHNELIASCLKLIDKAKDLLQSNPEAHAVTLEYLFHFYKVFNQLDVYNQNYGYIEDVKALRILFKELLSNQTLDFYGEPIQGLQIMGVLETRVLDFKHLIIASCNEGVLPAGRTTESFIPYELKREYGLPTVKEKDAIYAYHFYRLLHRAEKVYLLHNSAAEGLGANEKSRFLTQLEKDPYYTFSVKSSHVGMPSTTQSLPLKHIPKTPEMLNRLQEIATAGFSPSALTSYIRNPMDFYFRKILRINDIEEVEESIAANTFGTVIHESLELLYRPFVGTMLVASKLEKLLPEIDLMVSEQYKKHYGNANEIKGKNLIAFAVAKQYVATIIQNDLNLLAQGNTIEIVGLEQQFTTPFFSKTLQQAVQLRGTVDRIERYNGQLRIIDYKTGKVQRSDLKVSDWSLFIEDYKYAKAFQVLTYAKMFLDHYPSEREVISGIYSLKNMQEGFMPFVEGPSRGKGNSIITREGLAPFQEQLDLLIAELFDPTIPIEEKEV